MTRAAHRDPGQGLDDISTLSAQVPGSDVDPLEFLEVGECRTMDLCHSPDLVEEISREMREAAGSDGVHFAQFGTDVEEHREESSQSLRRGEREAPEEESLGAQLLREAGEIFDMGASTAPPRHATNVLDALVNHIARTLKRLETTLLKKLQRNQRTMPDKAKPQAQALRPFPVSGRSISVSPSRDRRPGKRTRVEDLEPSQDPGFE